MSGIVAALKSNIQLGQTLGDDPKSVRSYSDPGYQYRSLEDAINSMEPPSALLAHDASELENTGP